MDSNNLIFVKLEHKRLLYKGMTFLALFMALSFIVIIVIFFFLLCRSWIKALLFFITFETVIDLKNFMNNLTKLKDESMI